MPMHTCRNLLLIVFIYFCLCLQFICFFQKEHSELTIRCVDPEEIQYLNKTYRHQDKPTNVLAFPSELPPEIYSDCPLLGDVIICPTVLAEESLAGDIALKNHWAHILIHGILHLLGYDHIKPEDAILMENHEINILGQLGFDNPYHGHEERGQAL